MYYKKMRNNNNKRNKKEKKYNITKFKSYDEYIEYLIVTHNTDLDLNSKKYIINILKGLNRNKFIIFSKQAKMENIYYKLILDRNDIKITKINTSKLNDIRKIKKDFKIFHINKLKYLDLNKEEDFYEDKNKYKDFIDFVLDAFNRDFRIDSSNKELFKNI